jgi:hypothetical protein
MMTVIKRLIKGIYGRAFGPKPRTFRLVFALARRVAVQSDSHKHFFIPTTDVYLC